MERRPLTDGEVEAMGTVALFLFGVEKEYPKSKFATIDIRDAVAAFSHLVGWPETDLRSKIGTLLDRSAPDGGR